MNDAQKIILMGKADELLAEAERVNETPTHIVRASALMSAEWMQNEMTKKFLAKWWDDIVYRLALTPDQAEELSDLLVKAMIGE